MKADTGVGLAVFSQTPEVGALTSGRKILSQWNEFSNSKNFSDGTIFSGGNTSPSTSDAQNKLVRE